MEPRKPYIADLLKQMTPEQKLQLAREMVAPIKRDLSQIQKEPAQPPKPITRVR